LTDRELGIVFGSGDDGTSDFEKGLKLLGFRYKQTDKGTLNKLKSWLLRDYLPVVHVVVKDGCGHYMVVVGYDKENVYLVDPANGEIVKYGIPFFLGIWKIEEGETQTRWFLVITGKSKNRINALIKRLRNIKK
jgi:predicted double-glycine peptidase